MTQHLTTAAPPFIFLLLSLHSQDTECLTLPIERLTNASTTHHSNVTVQGWTPQPNGRGTIDIIWACVATIFLCSWSVLCVNVPAESDSNLNLLWRKLCLTILGIAGPEFILQMALGQYISARRAKKAFHDAGYKKWTLTHSFFADMRGFLLHTTDFVPFPLDALQLHYLVTKGYVDYPTITEREIDDRNKVDTLLRVITVMQTLWFIINCIARAAQRLPIATFELTTVSFIFCTLGTYFCWGRKPADVNVAVSLESKESLRKILLEAEPSEKARRPYSRTPLEFISRKEWSWSLWWAFLMNTVRKLFHLRFQPEVRPMNRIPNDLWLEVPSAGIFALGIVDMCYAGIYFFGWNFYFPTAAERILWHVSTCLIFAVIACYLMIESFTFYLVPALPAGIRRWHSKLISSATWRQDAKLSRLQKVLNRLRNNSPNRDAMLYLPLKASIPITVTGFIYGLARSYLLIECALALRELPAGAYKSVNWSALFPHI